MKEVENAPAVAPAGTLAEIARKYLDAYQGRDSSRYHRISAWIRLLGDNVLTEITPDDIDNACSRWQPSRLASITGATSTTIRFSRLRAASAAAQR